MLVKSFLISAILLQAQCTVLTQAHALKTA
jgi:hypothetical protein